MAVKPIPDGYHSVTPYLVVRSVAEVIDFMEKAFDAKVILRMKTPEGGDGHAEVQVGDSKVMMGEGCEKFGAMPAALYVYVPDVDATYRRALDAGGASEMEPTTHFYGDRSAGVKDSCGNRWWIATHVEDVAPDELARRAAEAYKEKMAATATA